MNSDRFHWKKYREQILQIHTSGHIDKDNLVSNLTVKEHFILFEKVNNKNN